MKPPSVHPPPSSLEKRLRRIESRLVQLMIHMGLNPYSKQYSDNDVPESKQDEKEKNGHQ